MITKETFFSQDADAVPIGIPASILEAIAMPVGVHSDSVPRVS